MCVDFRAPWDLIDRLFELLVVIAILVLVGACKKGASSPWPVVSRTERTPVEVTLESSLFFTYVAPNGMFATTEKAEKVPEVTRRLVRIMARTKGEPPRLNNAKVEIVDVGELLARGKTRPRVMLREDFETGALAQPVAGRFLPAGRSTWPALGRGT